MLTGDNVMIGGVIITGTEEKKVIFRAVGNSIKINGVLVPERIKDPTLSLHNQAGAEIAFNDDWGQAPEPERTEIENSGLKPEDPQEPAILRTLAPGQYTAIVRGEDNTTGISVVEVYDLNPASSSKLANLSTRAFVATNDNLMIGGAIVDGTGVEVVVRGIGPSLNANGVPLEGRLANPTLRLVNENGMTIGENDNWKSDQENEIQVTGLAPTNDAESAIRLTLPAGNTTALLRGKDDATGIGLFEIYELSDPQSQN